MMQMHYFHEISRQVASNHRASEKAHSRKLSFRHNVFSETYMLCSLEAINAVAVWVRGFQRFDPPPGFLDRPRWIYRLLVKVWRKKGGPIDHGPAATAEGK